MPTDERIQELIDMFEELIPQRGGLEYYAYDDLIEFDDLTMEEFRWAQKHFVVTCTIALKSDEQQQEES